MEGWQSLVECTGLENRQVSNGLVGSNPTPSAKKFLKKVFIIFRDKRIFFYENLILKSLILLFQKFFTYLKSYLSFSENFINSRR